MVSSSLAFSMVLAKANRCADLDRDLSGKLFVGFYMPCLVTDILLLYYVSLCSLLPPSAVPCLAGDIF